ncbi:phospholipase effector Tle1 domain-containing protein [Alcaligenes faecalis]|uniref:phospholipase effector Tle1 domain-containing protein n=1 Tax=Alcaligenes faecalis TaxID=511 RepID=UPI0007C529AF|nr:DUF2235 domain-containing protein [Alcaligenes faecalis]
MPSALLSWLILLLITLPSLAWSQSSLECPLPPSSTRCAPAAALGEQAEPAPDMGLLNPVDLLSGQKYQSDTDLPLSQAWPLLQLQRHWNGQGHNPTPTLGHTGWALNYDLQLRQQGHALFLPDGRQTRLYPPAQVQRTGWFWQGPNGLILRFDEQGWLTHVRVSTQQWLDIERFPGAHPQAYAVKTVRNHLDQTLVFDWQNQAQEQVSPQGQKQGHGRGQNQTPVQTPRQVQPQTRPLANVTTAIRAAEAEEAATAAATTATATATATAISIKTPAGPFRLLLKQHDQQIWLASVSRPDGMQRLYHPAPAPWSHHLGGTSLQAPGQTAQPMQQWEYDVQGRVSRLISHAFNQDWTARYEPGLSEWSIDTERHRFHYRDYQGQQRLQKLESRVCDTCPVQSTEWQYDPQGRWLQVGPWTAQRRVNGTLSGLEQSQGGWGPLRLELDEKGRLQSWATSQHGGETRRWNPNGKLRRLEYAEGGSLHIQYDQQGRLSSLEHQQGHETERSELDWLGPGALRIRHPMETQWLKLRAGLLQERRLERSHSPSQSWTERFEYDEQRRLTQHTLPEGGQLRYRWDAHGRLQSLEWITQTGQRQTVIHAQEVGYAWGNGLQLISHANSAGQAVDLMLLQPDGKPVWTQARRLDAQGKVLEDRHEYPLLQQARHWFLQYDAQNRLIAFRQGKTESAQWLAWNDSGALVARHPKPAASIQRSSTGTTKAVGNLNLDYGPNRRLQRVQTAHTTLVEYRHDAFGQRIWRKQGDQERAFFFHGQQLMAELDLPAGPGQLISRRYLYAGLTPIGMIVYQPDGQGQLYYLHSDLMGAVRLISDQQAKPVWTADLNPFGQAEPLLETLEFNLRLPGQYAESATGWHDNLLRTYLPEHGHYLEPDPLGPWPQTQAVGYARQQPWRHIDPTGLLLFAFDGTRQAPITNSNVWKLSQLYQDGAVHYAEGPGDPVTLNWDALTAWRAGRILESQWNNFLNRMQEQGPAPSAVPVDLLGFSRGAALARDFSNRILDHVQQGWFVLNDPQRGAIRACITPRFLGLFDTVAQFGLGGASNSQYRLGVSDAWSWVAHAVAMHEHRAYFPLSSLTEAMNTVEMPFIGAHSQIGGGVLPDENEETISDLDKVALAWMHWQARATGLTLAELGHTDLSVLHPVLLDMRLPGLRLTQGSLRGVDSHGQGQNLMYQDLHPRLGQATQQSMETVIKRHNSWRIRPGHQVGWVDMDAYDTWLHNHLGWERQAS